VNTVLGTVSDTSITVGTNSVAANSCSSASTATMTGLATTMAFAISPASDVSGVTGWGPSSSGQLYVDAWPTANTLNYKVCNPTSASITPSSNVTFNVAAR
jgi:hypothetical protein